MKVGITGHQNLGDQESQNWLKSQLEIQVQSLQPDLGYSCLAVGADQLFIQVLIKFHIPYVAVIPCNNYEQTFADISLTSYKSLLKQASNKIELNNLQPTEKAFFDASSMVVNNCEVLIAIWNGLPVKGFGGTGDVVLYAKSSHKKIIHLNPIDKTIKNI